MSAFSSTAFSTAAFSTAAFDFGTAPVVVSDLPQPGGGGKRAWKDKKRREEKNVYVPLDDATKRELFPEPVQAAPTTIKADAQAHSPAPQMMAGPIPLAQPQSMDPALVAALFDVFDQLDEE